MHIIIIIEVGGSLGSCSFNSYGVCEHQYYLPLRLATHLIEQLRSHDIHVTINEYHDCVE